MRDIYYEGQAFRNLNLHDEIVEDSRFIDCIFIDCSFEDIRIINSSFIDCKFEKCTIINLKGEENSEIKGLDFVNSQLIGINWKEMIPDNAFVDPIDKIKKSSLKYNTFFNINLKRIDLSDNEIIDSLFTECELGESKFKSCRLEKTEFIRSNLRKSDFRDAKGYEIDVTSCKVQGARFSFPEAINLLNSLGIKID